MIVAMEWPFLIALGAFGAILGSFLNACVFRLPRGVSMITPPSACPRCGTPIRWHDNVPVLGWLLLHGRCRSCRESISPRYPVVEALTALVFLLLALHYGPVPELPLALCFAWIMILVTLVDFDARIIPDAVTLPGIALGFLAALVGPLSLRDAVIGAGLGLFLLWGIAWVYERVTGIEGMGGGDIKFAAMLGAFLGWKGLLVTLFLASLGGALTGGVLMALRRGGGKTALPFGSFLAPAALLVYVYGDALLRWYVHLAFGGRMSGRLG
jgi:leader peptidase (prepilin peptidase) / N-methyltransferase